MSNDRAAHLRVKVRTNAAEAKIIRNEERKALSRYRSAVERELQPKGGFCLTYERLRDHRVKHLRALARIDHLAYGFLRGVAYAAMELHCALAPDFELVRKTALRFGGDQIVWDSWMQAAEAHLAGAPPAAVDTAEPRGAATGG